MLNRPNRHWALGLLWGTAVLVALAPFYGQYLILRRELAFTRAMAYEGGWFSFLATPPINRLYGELTEPLLASEAMLFPGASVVLLALAGIWVSVSPPRPAAVRPPAPLRGRTMQ